MQKREYIFDTIKRVFRLYGYKSIETPAMENLSTLLGKYGDEGDKLLFRILNSGDFLSDINKDDLISVGASSIASKISEKGLRYDLTVPFARYVVQRRNEITFPFKRYQIQPVWRADRPQKGRYREFFQCDADVIGSDSLLNEFELLRIIEDIFSSLEISIIIKINNRKILTGIAEYLGEGEKLTDITVAIDKIDKIGTEAVNAELREKGISAGSVAKLQPILNLTGTNEEKLAALETILRGSVTGNKGISEMRELLSFADSENFKSRIELDLTLARGLNYYTGAIIEVKSADVAIGSICGGGRYDDLTGIFGLPGVSGVGISFGADRIYDVMEQLQLFRDISVQSTEVLILNFGGRELVAAVKLSTELRKQGIRTELYPDPVKIGKQISYANTGNIPYIILAGGEEMKNGFITIKTMSSGEQMQVTTDEAVSFICSLLR
jgi:histidyl-tRNA synthetase